MAQTKAGAIKTAAKKAGLSLDAFLSRLDAGERKCTKCKEWRLIAQFCSDRTRPEGIGKTCILCRRVSERKVLKGRVSTFKGRKHTASTITAMSATRKGKPNLKLRGQRRHIDTRIKISRSHRENGKTIRGERHPAFKGGDAQGGRATAEYKRWRFDVYSRDKFTCQECGDNRGGNMNAHHIKPFADYPELRFDVSNGVTLCWDCHDKKHAAKVSRLRRRKARGQLSLPL